VDVDYYTAGDYIELKVGTRTGSATCYARVTVGRFYGLGDTGPAGPAALLYVGGTTVSGSAATDMTVSGLDLNTDDTYVIHVEAENALGSAPIISLYFNADTTATNYDTQRHSAASTTNNSATANDSSIATFPASPAQFISRMTLSKGLDGNPMVLMNSFTGANGVTPNIELRSNRWRTSGTNVTGITIRSATANAFKIGSRVRVWKMMPVTSVGDHGFLAGLGDDDHTQYLNNTRGDARYLQLTGGTLTGSLTVSSASPELWLTETDGSTNNKTWRLVAASEGLYGQIWNDAISAATTWLTVQRTAHTAVDSVELAATDLILTGTTQFQGTTVRANNDGFYVDWANSMRIVKPVGSYGSMAVYGQKNGYAGLEFKNSSGTQILMVSGGADNMGWYKGDSATWHWYYGIGYFWVTPSLYIVPRCEWATGGSSGSAHFTTSSSAAPTGNNGDVHFRTGASRGLYIKVAGTWELVAS
jgi:hypothetical protein